MNKESLIKLINTMSEDEFDVMWNIIEEDVILKREEIIEEFRNETGDVIIELVEQVFDKLENF